jgi:two-component system alkaline phosphatase synthesis response regulator PhoP
MPERILIVEDEWQMRMLLRDNLQFEGYEVACVGSGEEALRDVVHFRPDLILLDLMLPGIDGFEVCRRLRSEDVESPIIMITVRKAELQRVTGLDLGADDYVTKPFSVMELLARIRVQLRRVARARPACEVLRIGSTEINLTNRTVTRNGGSIDLSQKEFELLKYLAARAGQDVTREQLLRDVWGYNEGSVTRTVDNFVAKLRHKMDAGSGGATCIVTVHGLGYRFCP